MNAHHTSSGMQKPEQGIRSPGAAVANSCGCLEPNLASLLEQQVLLTEPSLQPQNA